MERMQMSIRHRVSVSGLLGQPVHRSAPAKVELFIDSSKVAEHTENLPPQGTNVRWVAGLGTTAAVARNFRIGWIYVENDQ